MTKNSFDFSTVIRLVTFVEIDLHHRRLVTNSNGSFQNDFLGEHAP